jgi:hypothetical protein
MKKLIKISDYYYVVDDEAERKEGDFLQFTVLKDNSPFICKWINDADLCKEYNHGVVVKRHFDILGEKGNKIIATTNHNLLLPQITNASDDMVGKEVEVKFYPVLNTVDIKPISKETSTNEILEYKPWSNLMANANGFNSLQEQEEWINKGCPETLEYKIGDFVRIQTSVDNINVGTITDINCIGNNDIEIDDCYYIKSSDIIEILPQEKIIL